MIRKLPLRIFMVGLGVVLIVLGLGGLSGGPWTTNPLDNYYATPGILSLGIGLMIFIYGIRKGPVRRVDEDVEEEEN